ncbi:hypothetical protein Plhal304r1_c076g0163711 [Plasmopara halstedii]
MPSLAGSESARGQSLTSSPARCATSDGTSAASREAHPKPPTIEHHAHRLRRISSSGIGGGRLRVGQSFDKDGKKRRARCDMSPAQTLRTPCPFPGHLTSAGSGIITSPRRGTGTAVGSCTS